MLPRIARFSVPAIVLWSAFVWGSRVRNIWNDESRAAGGGVFDSGMDRSVLFSLLVAAAFVLGSLWAIRSMYGLWRDGASDPLTCATGAALALAIGSIVVWPVRMYAILGGELTVRGRRVLTSTNDWDTGFKLVHSALALVSIGLGLLVLFHRYGRAGNSRPIRNRQSVADPV